jgi:uncharacterized protein (DUF433 family)
MKKANAVVSIDPETMSGTPVFTGTRVPIVSLVDHLTAGISIDEFLDDFPSVTREQVIAFLENATLWAIADVEKDHSR